MRAVLELTCHVVWTANAHFNIGSIKSLIWMWFVSSSSIRLRVSQSSLARLSVSCRCTVFTNVMVMALCLQSTTSILHITDDSFRWKSFLMSSPRVQHRRVCWMESESHCAFLSHQGVWTWASGRLVIHYTACRAWCSLMFHSRYLCALKLTARFFCQEWAPTSPPAYARQSPAAISLTAISHSLFWEPYLMLF